MHPSENQSKTTNSYEDCVCIAVPSTGQCLETERTQKGGVLAADHAGIDCVLSDLPANLTSSLAAERSNSTRKPLYTAEQRARRDATPWTKVQAVLAPLQFMVFLISLGLVAYYLMTGRGYEVATVSILIKTFLLYAIMVTGSIWEKVVFGEWLFADAFFWEDVFSMLVLALQTLYVIALLKGWWTPQQQIYIAIAAYGTYLVNAGQFLWKLRLARLESQNGISSVSVPASGSNLAGQQT